MQSRMDKYNNSGTQIKTRTQKNQNLYEDVRNSSLTEFDVNSNVSVIDNQSDVIDVNRIKKMLDRRYSDSAPKRRSIELPEYDEPIIEEPLVDTKEYDINAILAKAKQGKNVDYNKERLKKVRETQFEILNNLDLELKKVEETKSASRQQEEQNLMNLINTITELELKNREKYSKEENDAADLLDLDYDEEEENEIEISKKIEEEEKVDDIVIAEEPEEVEITMTSEIEVEEKEEPDEEEEKSRDDHIEETLSKLNIDISSYEEFKDVSKNDIGSIILKIIIFIIIIALVIGGVYIMDDILSLGLFNN